MAKKKKPASKTKPPKQPAPKAEAPKTDEPPAMMDEREDLRLKS
jgi:hypothetical protein